MQWIGIVGARDRDDQATYQLVYNVFFELYVHGQHYIVSGGCPHGADRFAELIAKDFSIPIMIYYPDKRKGIDGLFERNTYIAEQCDILIATPSLNKRGGTYDTIRKATELNKRVISL